MRWKAKIKIKKIKQEIKPSLGDIRNIQRFLLFPRYSRYHQEYVWLENAVIKQRYEMQRYHEEKNNFLDWVDIEVLPRGAFPDTEIDNHKYFFRLCSKKG